MSSKEEKNPLIGAGKKSTDSLESCVASFPFWAMSLLDLVHINVKKLFRKTIKKTIKTDVFLMKEKPLTN